MTLIRGGCFCRPTKEGEETDHTEDLNSPESVHRAATQVLDWLTDSHQKHGLPAESLKSTLSEMHDFLLEWYDHRMVSTSWPLNISELEQEAIEISCTKWPRLSRAMLEFEARRLWNIYTQSPHSRGVTFWTHYIAASGSRRFIDQLDTMVRRIQTDKGVVDKPIVSESTVIQNIKQVTSRPSIKQRTPDWYAIRPSTLGASTKAKHTPATYFGIGWYDFQYGGQRKYGFHPVDGSWLANLQEKVTVVANNENQNIFGATTAVGRGRMYEPVVGQDTTLMCSTRIDDVGMFVDQLYPYNAVSPDGVLEVAGEGASIEFKCPDSDQYATEQPFEKYACQMLSSGYINQVSVLPFVTSHYIECSKEAASYRNKPQLLLKRQNLDLDERYLYPPMSEFSKQQKWAEGQLLAEEGWSIHYYEKQKWRSHILHMTPTMRWIYTHYQVLVDELWYYYIMEGRARPETLGVKPPRVRKIASQKIGRCLL